VQVVGGDRVAVTTLVGPDEDAHVFEARPNDAKTVLSSQLVVTNGLGFEPWAKKLIQSAGYQGATVVACTGVKARHLGEADKAHAGHDDTDPHAWQNPNNVVLYVRNIAAGLAKVDPAGASVYQANAEAYVKELNHLDQWAQAQIATIAAGKRKVITSHDAFGYFAAHYGVQFLAPQGMSTETEPSAKQVARLIRQIQREKIRAVFVENMSNPKLIAQLSQDAGATVGASLYADALSAPTQPGSTYLKMMRHNVTQLVAGMKLN
jgi:zinc/manganese transport system substrate-binding protein